MLKRIVEQYAFWFDLVHSTGQDLLPRRKGHNRTSRSLTRCPSSPTPHSHTKDSPAPESPYSYIIARGFLNVPQNYQHSRNCETGTPAYHPYPRRLESLTICRWNYKGSTFLLSYLKMSVGPVAVSNSRTPALQPGAQPSEPPVRGGFPSPHSILTPFTVYTVHKSLQFAFTRDNQSEVVAENGRISATMRWNGSTSLQEREGSILNFRKPFQNGKSQGKGAFKFLYGFAVS